MIVDGMFIREVWDTQHGKEILLLDHINGFDQHFKNDILQDLDREAGAAGQTYVVRHNQILDAKVQSHYPNLHIRFDLEWLEEVMFRQFNDFRCSHTPKRFQNFLCCFMAAEHISRQFLSAILCRQGLWNNLSCTKNFRYGWDTLDGNLAAFLPGQQHRVFRKFFVDLDSDINQRTINQSYQHCANISNLRFLEPIYHTSWINIVANEMGTSYQPMVSEKVLSAIATKSLWLAYGQLGFHEHVEHNYGFRLHRDLFDYGFDSIGNPVLRLVALIDSISKFRHLSALDWHDLYLLEQDTINHNLDHLQSKAYLVHARRFCD